LAFFLPADSGVWSRSRSPMNRLLKLSGSFLFFRSFALLLAMTALVRGQDGFEPDDTPLDARAIRNGESQNRTLVPAGDVDWVTFTIATNGAANLRLETFSATGLLGDTELWLYDSRNLTKEIAYNDDGSAATRFSLITLVNVAAGTYYVKVGSKGADSSISSYTLRATWTDRPDTFEPDNSAAAAKPITNGEVQEHSIHLAGDEDWISFSVGANGADGVRIETSGPAGDTEMWLYAQNNLTTPLAYNDDAGDGKFSVIALDRLAAGGYYVRVTAYAHASTISSYSLRATWADPGITGDRYEPDDTPELAAPIANGQIQERSIHNPKDLDWATFAIGANGVTNLKIETGGTTGDTELWLYGPGNSTTLLANNDDSALGKFSTITLPSLVPGKYYIKVAAHNSVASIAAYTLRVTWTEGVPPAAGDQHESNNTPETATSIANGEVQTHSIHTQADVDWLKFVIGPAGASSVRVETAGSAGDTEIWLFGPNSSVDQRRYDDDGGSGKFAAFTMPSLVPGTYYIKVQSYRQGSVIPAYTVQVSWSNGLPPPSRIVNLSVRSSAGTGAESTVIGFVLSGTGSKQLLVRGVGPTLTSLGVPNALADPSLQLFNGPVLLGANDNWGGGETLRNAASAAGAFALPATSRDAAILPSLVGGNYSVQIGGGTGIVLVELYDAGSVQTTRLVNISARANVRQDAELLIAGFVIAGIEAKTVLIRGVGPGLSQFGLSGALVDPKIELFRGSTLIDLNDNWGGGATLTEVFTRVGAFPLAAASRDAALLVDLLPGAYSVQVSGNNGGTGPALVEIYELP
jgi:hypothetical protein